MVALFGSAPGQWGSIEAYTCFFLAAGTGLRRNEILALRWSDVSSSILRVESQFVRYSDKRSAPKSKRGRLTEIPHRVEEALEAWHKLTKFPEPESLIFCGPDGLRRGATWWLKAFRRAMSALKIDYTVRNLKPHSFRHTLVSRLRSSGGVSDKAIRDAIGHGTEAIQDRYTHQDEDSVRGIGKAVDEII
ncbi:MAG: tyrosine-type recombinase/integrase [Spirochaetales bacterium]|nr:tyrosine-type recombinase/integrase [Spirochaetales bacterium]